jgi:hypothetical protein
VPPWRQAVGSPEDESHAQIAAATMIAAANANGAQRDRALLSTFDTYFM